MPDTATVKALREERLKTWERMKELLDTGKRDDKSGLAVMSAEDTEAFDKAEARLSELDADIERRQRAAEIEARLNAPQGTELADKGDPSGATGDPAASYAEAFDSYIRSGFAQLDTEKRSALRAGFSEHESRDIGVATGSAGGYLVPQGFLVKLTEVLKYYGPMRQLANVIETASGNAMPWPNNDDTGNVGSILGENVAVSTLDVALTTKTLNAYMYTSGLVKASWQLLNDSAFDVESFLSRKLGQRIGRIQNTHFTTGSGSSQPQGVQQGVTAAVTLPTGNTTSITYAGLVDLVHSLNFAYRQGGNAKFMTSDKALGTIRKIVDTNGRPIWTPSGSFGSLAGHDPDDILGYPALVNSDIPVPAANALSVGFGDWNQNYIIRDVVGTQMVRLDERFADQLQVGFFAFCRTDGKQDDTAAAAWLAQSAT